MISFSTEIIYDKSGPFIIKNLYDKRFGDEAPNAPQIQNYTGERLWWYFYDQQYVLSITII